VFRSKVRHYRQLGYEMVEVDEQTRRAKVRISGARTNDGMLQRAPPGKHDLYRLIEVDATGTVRDVRVYG
jgi:hypothetical protein